MGDRSVSRSPHQCRPRLATATWLNRCPRLPLTCRAAVCHQTDLASILDPDIDQAALKASRPPGWRGALGQVSAALSHLRNLLEVGPGDLFLFCGTLPAIRADHGGLALHRSEAAWDLRVASGRRCCRSPFGRLACFGPLSVVGKSPSCAPRLDRPKYGIHRQGSAEYGGRDDAGVWSFRPSDPTFLRQIRYTISMERSGVARSIVRRCWHDLSSTRAVAW